MRLRTVFYGTLCKLLFLDEATFKFKVFMEPFTRLLRSLSGQDEAAFTTLQVRTVLVGVLRDLRGVVCACSNRRAYGLFFEWLYPAFTPLMLVPLIRSMLLSNLRAPSPLPVALTMHSRSPRPAAHDVLLLRRAGGVKR